jgi:hypothetical protein
VVYRYILANEELISGRHRRNRIIESFQQLILICHEKIDSSRLGIRVVRNPLVPRDA